jgi:hypothetical protein
MTFLGFVFLVAVLVIGVYAVFTDQFPVSAWLLLATYQILSAVTGAYDGDIARVTVNAVFAGLNCFNAGLYLCEFHRSLWDAADARESEKEARRGEVRV